MRGPFRIAFILKNTKTLILYIAKYCVETSNAPDCHESPEAASEKHICTL